ncbi:D,D-heptose 1,7-bisphosphate phosphatase [Candidatus Woesearchaeota archaeon]|nr:MAG: D,D-heptose 1,7-bisphosphate phosphatase [Candidatus Woesearchaeota archaeon]
MMNKAIFIDRDGTINKDSGYTHKLEDLEFEDNAIEGLKLIKEKLPFYKIIIITNQAGIAKGHYDENAFHSFMDHLLEVLERKGIGIEDYYFCPHHEKGLGDYKKACDCRKPNPGMILKAIKDHDIDTSKSYMIGDKWADVKAGDNAELRSILVMTGDKGNDIENKVESAFIAKDLKDAIEYVVRDKN